MPASVEVDGTAPPSPHPLLSAAPTDSGPRDAVENEPVSFRPLRAPGRPHRRSRRRRGSHRSFDRPTPGHAVRATNRPWLTALVVAAVCVVGSVAVVRAEWNQDDDGASVVPLVALAGIALAALRWRPTHDARPSREVTTASAVGVATLAVAFTVTLELRPEWTPLVVGPTVSLTLVGTYLALWGHRLLALLP